MSHPVEHLFASNRGGSERMHAEAPACFIRSATQQSPECLASGCSHGRVRAD